MGTANQFRQALHGPPGSPASYKFGPFVLDTFQHALLKDGKTVALTPKTYDTLLVLVQNRGRMLSKDELMKALWPDSFVEESNLTQQVSMIRRALGESPSNPRYIVTVPSRGYRFIAEIRNWGEETPVSRLSNPAAESVGKGIHALPSNHWEHAVAQNARALPALPASEDHKRTKPIVVKIALVGLLVLAVVAVSILLHHCCISGGPGLRAGKPGPGVWRFFPCRISGRIPMTISWDFPLQMPSLRSSIT